MYDATGAHGVWLQDEVVLDEGIQVAHVQDVGQVGVERVVGALDSCVGGGKDGVAQVISVQVGCR